MKFPAFMLLALTAMLWWVGNVEAKPTLVVQDEQAITCDSWGWRDNALAASSELGARAVRINMLEWRKGCGQDDAAVAAVAAAGMRPQLALAGSGSYMREKVLLHRDHVNTYSVWNEPDLDVWRCCSAPFLERPWADGKVGPHRAYRATYKRAYRMIKRTDPGARVCLGEISPKGFNERHRIGVPSPSRWLAKLLRGKRPLRADCLAIHPYHWWWSAHVDRSYFRALVAFKRAVRGLAQQRRLCRPRRPGPRRCRPVPIYNTEYGMDLSDGQAGDAREVARAWRYCIRLRFRQCAQYMVFPTFNKTHSAQKWQTGLTDLNCRPTATFYALRRAVTGRRGLARIAWPECPKPIPATRPLPPGWGTPLAPPLPPAPPEPPVVEEPPLPDQPPILEVPLPVPPLEEIPIELPGPPEPAVEPTPEPPVEPPVEPPPVEVPPDLPIEP